MSKAKDRRKSKDKGYYERQIITTRNNKSRKALKRVKDHEYWLKVGVKKNGKRVKTEAIRKENIKLRPGRRALSLQIAKAAEERKELEQQQRRHPKEKEAKLTPAGQSYQNMTEAEGVRNGKLQ